MPEIFPWIHKEMALGASVLSFADVSGEGQEIRGGAPDSVTEKPSVLRASVFPSIVLRGWNVKTTKGSHVLGQ